MYNIHNLYINECCSLWKDRESPTCTLYTVHVRIKDDLLTVKLSLQRECWLHFLEIFNFFSCFCLFCHIIFVITFRYLQSFKSTCNCHQKSNKIVDTVKNRFVSNFVSLKSYMQVVTEGNQVSFFLEITKYNGQDA